MLAVDASIIIRSIALNLTCLTTHVETQTLSRAETCLDRLSDHDGAQAQNLLTSNLLQTFINAPTIFIV